MKPKFIAAADLHLNLNMWNSNKAIIFDSLFGFYSLLHLAHHYGVPLVIAGDVFDSKVVGSSLLLYTKCIRDHFKDVDIYYVAGNHDNSSPHWLTHIDNTYHLARDPVVINDIKVCGMDYQLLDDFEESLNSVYPYSDVIITHQTYDCFFKSPSAINHKLLDGRRFVISGDYHKCLNIELEDKTWVLSPGSSVRCSISEDYPTAYLMFKYVDSGSEYSYSDIVDFSRVYLPRRNFFQVKAILDSSVQFNCTLYEYLSRLEQEPVMSFGGDLAWISVPSIDFNEFIETVSKAFGSIDLPPKLDSNTFSNVYVARNKEQVEVANEIVKVLKGGYVLYSPDMPKASTEDVDSELPSSKDDTSSYLKHLLDTYPCDDKVRKAAVDYLFNDTNDFLTAEAERFGLYDN